MSEKSENPSRRRLLLAALGVLVIAVAVVLIVTLTGGEPRYVYPAEAKEQILVDCQAGATPDESDDPCQCVVDELQETVPYQDLRDAELAGEPEGIPGLEAIIDMCRE